MSDLAGLERAAYRREPDRVARLLAAVSAFSAGALAVEAGAGDGPPLKTSAAIARLAAAAAAILTDPDAPIRPADADRAFALKPMLDQLFGASALESADALIVAMDEAAPLADLRRLILQSLDSGLAMSPEAILALPPRLAQLVVVALVASKPVRTEAGQARRDRLLELAADLAPADLPPTADHLVTASSAWMLCSYADSPAKHAIKPVLNRALTDFGRRLGLRSAVLPPLRALTERPTLVVAAEVMNSVHVQYRYFGQYLRQLRTRFELVLVTEAREADGPASALFDRVETVERRADGGHLTAIPRLIQEAKPDMVFWPSIGMRHWGPLIANLRLAPIQFTALGHSASSFCEPIDYYLLEEGYVSDPTLFGETVLTLPDDSLVFERPPQHPPVAPQLREAASPFRVALPSNILKLNPRFLRLLAEIRAKAKRPVEFHVLANTRGLEADAFETALQQLLPGARQHRATPYARYAQILAACDLNLSPFPFGGLHSVIDSLRQGVPVVAMRCPEPHGRTDAMLLRRLGMPDWLVADDEVQYAAAALRIIDDDALRLSLARQALALDIDRVMFGDGTTSLRSEVVEAVWWMYRNHEAIQADGRKAWSQADRASAFSA